MEQRQSQRVVAEGAANGCLRDACADLRSAAMGERAELDAATDRMWVRKMVKVDSIPSSLFLVRYRLGRPDLLADVHVYVA